MLVELSFVTITLLYRRVFRSGTMGLSKLTDFDTKLLRASKFATILL